MNGEDARAIQTQLTGIQESVSDLKTGQAGIRGKIETLEAIQKAHTETTEGKTHKLFQYRDDDVKRIGKIESAYVPRKAFVEHERTQREDFLAIHVLIGAIRSSVAKIVGAGVLALVLVEQLLRLAR